MAKHGKTLEQKKIAEYRRYQYRFKVNTVDYSSDKEALPQTSTITINSKYPYLARDIKKTALITFAILAIQIILFFILKQDLLVLPMIKY